MPDERVSMTAADTPTVESTEIVPLFPTLVWKMQLARETYEPINARIKSKLAELAAATPRSYAAAAIGSCRITPSPCPFSLTTGPPVMVEVARAP